MTPPRHGPCSAAALALVAIVALGLASCRDTLDPCGNELLSDVPSPSGAHHAVTFIRDCGATTVASVQVSVLRGDEALQGAGNAFTADARRDPTVPLVARLSWESDQVLRVEHDARLRVFKREERVAGIRLQYATH